jgi:hypothetical protein
VTVVSAPDGATVLRPPPVGDAIADVGAAVRDALRFPLSGSPLEALTKPGGSVTLVVEPPELPLPAAPDDPRRDALAAAIDELDRLGVRSQRQTILVAGGLNRRAGHHELEALLAPERARHFHGRVEVHDAEASDLVHLGDVGGTPLRVNTSLVEADLVVTVNSLLETASSRGWQLGLALERLLGARVPLIGASLVLNPPRLLGRFRGYPYEEAALRHLATSPFRRFSLLPSGLRRRLLDDLGRELTAVAAFAGPPSVAHAEALLRGIARRSRGLESPLDAIVLGMPWKHQHSPRERLNPITVASVALGLGLRLWRNAFPVAEGGTAVILHRFSRHFAHGTQDPYRDLFHVLREGRDPGALAAAERAAGADERAVAAYRSGRACHPLLPYADWSSCEPALSRLGAVLVAGCRDHQAARALGFVPTHGVSTALEMAHGRAGGEARIGLLLSPPYFPLEVGAA